MDAAQLPPTVSNDPDHDGILTDDEPNVDLDDDGLPCWFDSDCDGDDVPDSKDPDPFDPLVTGRQCAATPADIGCCLSLATCSGRREYVVYGTEAVRLRNATVSPDGKVASAGFGGVELAGFAQSGSIFSAGPVFLEGGAHVHGDVYTTQTFTAQLGAQVEGGVMEQATVSLPDLASFAPVLLPPVGGSVMLEPTEQDFINPGSYSQVLVKRDATLVLTTGTYHVHDLLIESGGTLGIDASTGPVYLYLGNTFIFRGGLEGASGSELFVGYIGAAPAFVETAFSGTIVAPNAELTLGPDSGNTQTYVGSFFAHRVRVRPGVVLIHHSFPLPWQSGSAS